MKDKKTPFLLETKIGGRWCPVRIAHEFPNSRAAIESLPILAKQLSTEQLRTTLDCVRVKALRTEEDLWAAENAIIEYNQEKMNDPRR